MTSEMNRKPRIGIPYRTRKEELKGERRKYNMYVEAVCQGGGEPVPVSLGLEPSALNELANTLDAIVLPGSPMDVDPARYHESRHPKTADGDVEREKTDQALLEHAFAAHKPVLAICYGVQSLNVFLGGTLVQDLPSEIGTQIAHPWTGQEQGAPEPRHPVRLEPGSRLARLAGAAKAEVNSSHHQSVRKPGRGLRVAAHAADGVIEAVEWTGDSNWVTGVQWHPERMAQTDRFAQSLFKELISAARQVPVQS
ncbi:MAG TPA: gamma-glutamyl-gamma-aminobutyrate hydrolase family protein [Candidatus Sulfotelmatobacter sp.]|nr:gamma-glutamyl-gamma-aminobutyrate hydrolase family protein [Candidatus Sulfotelmatobacter sp.]